MTKFVKKRHDILIIICCAAFVIPLVFTGPAISLHAVKNDIGGDRFSLEWIINSYVIAFGGFVMAAGVAGDYIGRKLCFITGLMLFTLSSTCIAFSHNLSIIITMRMLEGIGGALVSTSATSLLAQEFYGKNKTIAFSLLGTSFGAGLAFGPIIAGFMIDYLGWRSLYWGISIFSILIFSLGKWRIKESKNNNAERLDWIGIIIFTLALILFTYALILSGKVGFSDIRVYTIISFVILLIIVFYIVEKRVNNPLLDISLFKIPLFFGVQLLPLLTAFSYISLFVYLPIWLMIGGGFSASQTGVIILPLTLPMLVIPLLSGYLAKNYPINNISGIGFFIASVGVYMLINSTYEKIWLISFAMALIGIGNALPWGLMDALSVSVVPQEKAGLASGLFNTMRVAGEAIAITLVGSLINILTSKYINSNSIIGNDQIIAYSYIETFQVFFIIIFILSLLAGLFCLIFLKESDRINNTTNK
ncbi:MFS transporter [Xenorhabdus sp. XENO-10]|uniref:MFS transporter n=1 Tax=Xenorhabdus yunnanensis TaxID=3025878 RepID=A0ABT5LFG6_9GAMM|nr:MFS transporter [Xenorhabdus yunnanensis]MDC9588555.1 MFS transporter [Xenorhabdus yunnanensis]